MPLPVNHDKVIHMSQTIHDFFLMRQASLYNSNRCTVLFKNYITVRIIPHFMRENFMEYLHQQIHDFLSSINFITFVRLYTKLYLTVTL